MKLSKHGNENGISLQHLNKSLLTSATQTTMKSQNELVAELTVRSTNLEKTVERL